MANKKPIAMMQKTSHPHKPTRKVQESAEQARKISSSLALQTPDPTAGNPPQKCPEDMTVEEMLEQINAPVRAYLEENADAIDQPSPTAWVQHAQLRDWAEVKERSDCELDPDVMAEMIKGKEYHGDDIVEEDSSPELLSPPQTIPNTTGSQFMDYPTGAHHTIK